MKLFRTYRAHCARHIPTLSDSHVCKQMHGHTFNIIVYLEGPIDTDTGFMMDFFDLDTIVEKEVIKKETLIFTRVWFCEKCMGSASGLGSPL